MNPSDEQRATGTDATTGGAASRKLVDANEFLASRARAAEAQSASPTATSVNAAHLIRIEGELRSCLQRDALWQHLVNESAVLIPFGESLVLESRASLRGKSTSAWRVLAISGLAEVQRDAPMVLWYQRLVEKLTLSSDGSLQPESFELPQYADEHDPCTEQAALRHLLWLPLHDGGTALGVGWLLAADHTWEEQHITLASRLAQAYAHGALAIAGRAQPLPAWRRHKSRTAAFAGLALLLALVLALVKVPLMTLAPVEVVARAPFVVAAPVAGVVERIVVQPGTAVNIGEPLVQLVDTALRSDFEVAEQKLQVARAKMLRYQQASIGDSSAKRELAVAQTEAQVARAERDFAKAMLDKSVITAQQAGVALYGDPRDWVGRPVAVGEAIMQVANPQQVEFKLQVAVADAVNLRDAARVKVFLDAAPLQPIEAQVVRAAYKAETDPAGVASFAVSARAADAADNLSRLGLRGTARVYGEQVSLFYYLFRRPIVALRQWSGI